MERLVGIPQVFRDFERFKRAMELVPSDHNGLEFCLGCWSEMGEDLEEVIRHFERRDEVCYVHFCDVVGTVPSFHETWIDDGNFDALDVVQLLNDVGFLGIVIPDHTPYLESDTD